MLFVLSGNDNLNGRILSFIGGEAMARIIGQTTMIASLELPVRFILRPLVATTLSMGA